MSRPPRPRAHGLATEHRRRGTTHAEEARAAGVSLRTWMRWVAMEKAPSDVQLVALAKRWSVTTDALMAPPKARGARAAEREGKAAADRRRLRAALLRLVAKYGADAVCKASVDL